ncbi:hypothetical protein MXD81_26215, partial [Microbacteriaceae bacterium K1510]|nr:hypothetical protein [Microbacteriaceae bacterium K1510]
RLRREAARFEQFLERSMARNQRGSGYRPYAGSTGDAIGRIAAQRDEVRYLRRINAVPFFDLLRSDANKLAGPYRLNNG